jgi:hypothetical protein
MFVRASICSFALSVAPAFKRHLLRMTLGVKTGKSRSQQLFSDLPPEADLTADIVDVSQVP